MEIDYSITSIRIKRLMEKRGYKTGIEFANDLKEKFNNPKYNQVRISRWINRDKENTDGNFQLNELIDLATFFNCSIDFLVGITDCEAIDLKDKEICKKTGLSIESINNLNNLEKENKEVLNFILSSDLYSLNYLLRKIKDYFKLTPNPTSQNARNDGEFVSIKNKRINVNVNTKFIENCFFEEIRYFFDCIKEETIYYKKYLIAHIKAMEENLEDENIDKYAKKKYKDEIKKSESLIKHIEEVRGVNYE